MASSLDMSVSRSSLSATIRRVRNRWRLKLVLYGLTIVMGAALLALLVGPWLMERFRFDPPVVTGVRVATYVVLALLTLRYLVLPLTRRVGDDRVALYLEEHEPSLDAVVLSAVESTAREAPASVRSPRLVARLLESAVTRSRAVGGGARIEARSAAMSLAMLAAMIVAGAIALGWGPGFLRTGARLLAAPWKSAEEARPYYIVVEPGNAEVARGGDQVISARLHGFGAEETELAVQRGADAEWTRLPMSAGGDSIAFELRLFDLAERTAYYVEANGVRSQLFYLSVVNLPYVQKLDLEYHYPAYTGLANEIVENGGDIAAPRGTSVIVHAATTLPVKGGRLMIEGQPAIPMTLGADGGLTGTIAVTVNGFYKVELETTRGGTVPGSLDYAIDVLDDNGPTIAFLEPGRDSRVTAVEELFAEVEAADDYGLASVDLRYSVNGGPERVVPLYGGSARRKEVVAGHTFFLEELGLQPGDLVSYYARAADNDSASGGKVAKTDIYFLNVRPFEQEYTQSQQGQQPGNGGGEGQSAGELSQRQRDIIAGTFKVDRDRAQISAADLRENFATLLLSQSRLREQVETLSQRLVERGIMQVDSSFRVIAEELPLAAREMKAAEEQLGTKRLRGALAPEQRALQHLQRAEAAYREIQVQFGSAGGGGGGGGGSAQESAQDLADLFELQGDELRNQYETESRASPRTPDEVVDETAEKLKQLAARQQQETERLRSRVGGGGAQQSSGGGGGAQRQIAEETEELARQLERLARERPGDRELRESARRLREAASDMRRSATGASDGSVSRSASALEELNEARRLLDENKQGRGARDASDAARRAERIAEEQRAVGEEINRLGAAGGAAGEEAGEGRADGERRAREQRIMERKDTLASDIEELGSRLDRLARESRREQPEAARKLQEAAGEIRQGRLADKMRYSKGLVRSGETEYSRSFEKQLTQETDSLRQRVADAASALRSGGRERSEANESLQRTRDLVRGVQSLGDRMREHRRLDGDAAGGAGGAGGASAGRGLPGGGAAGAGGEGGKGGGQDVRQFTREYRQRRQDAEALRRELRGGGQGVETGDLESAIAGMRSLESEGTYEDQAAVVRLQSAVIERLKTFEFALRREMAADAETRPVLGGNAEVPPEFEALVAEYYRSLARSRNP